MGTMYVRTRNGGLRWTIRTVGMAAALAGFVAGAFGDVHTSAAPGMFDLYRMNRTLDRPNYITEDFLLLSYSMLFRDAVAEHELKVGYPGFAGAVHRLLSRAEQAGNSDVIKANRSFLTVLDAILSGSQSKSGLTQDAGVAGELEKIRAAAGPARSELLLQTIDYSQLRPRGHYTASPELSRYFTAVRYAGTALFYVKESAATGIDAAFADRLTRQAILLTQWIQADPSIRKWFDSYEARNAWLMGPSEDLRRRDLLRLNSLFRTAKTSAFRRRLLIKARREGRQPSIMAAPIDIASLEKDVTAADVLTGWRLLPGSFTPDSAAGQQLVYGNVGKYLGTGAPLSLTSVNGVPVKGFPLANEIMALLGSKEAERQLKASDETNYEGYAKAEQAARKQLARPAGLASEQLALLKDWFAREDGDGAAKLASARGFWVWGRHESVLAVKQSYTGVGKGLVSPDSRTVAWLDPSEELYAGMKKIARELEERLESKSFGEFSRILERCEVIAKLERAKRALPVEDTAFLNSLDLDLSALVSGSEHPIAVDVHTDANSGQILVEALGYPRTVAHDGALGARFTPEEFKHPLSDRLTDEKWLQLLHEREK